jgi:formylglycine-generating enzyme required for sulfatase activity
MAKVDEGKFNRQRVDVSINAFLLSKTEVTYWQWGLYCVAKKQEMGKPGWGSEGNNPAVLVNWYDAVGYCNWVSTQLGFEKVYKIADENIQIDWNAKGFRLPTEAEWEYAARGGPNQQTFEHSGSDDLKEVGWYSENSDSRTRPIATKKANSLGLFDMSGNVWEWCWDWYGETYDPNQNNNPKGPDKGSLHVLRGGSWLFSAIYTRVALRYSVNPDYRSGNIGFRLARQQ